MSTADNQAIALALGRIFRMAARPEQSGDVEEYERCRLVILNLAGDTASDYSPNYARDRLKGAQGDS